MEITYITKKAVTQPVAFSYNCHTGLRRRRQTDLKNTEINKALMQAGLREQVGLDDSPAVSLQNKKNRAREDQQHTTAQISILNVTSEIPLDACANKHSHISSVVFSVTDQSILHSTAFLVI